MNETIPHQPEKHLQRAGEALQAAQTLLEKELYNDCVSRSYYAVLHAAKAALSSVQVSADTHRAVRTMFSLHLVKTGKIEKEWSDIFSVQREDREIGDYDFDIPIDKDRAAKRVNDARRFIQRIKIFLQK